MSLCALLWRVGNPRTDPKLWMHCSHIAYGKSRTIHKDNRNTKRWKQISKRFEEYVSSVNYSCVLRWLRQVKEVVSTFVHWATPLHTAPAITITTQKNQTGLPADKRGAHTTAIYLKCSEVWLYISQVKKINDKCSFIYIKVLFFLNCKLLLYKITTFEENIEIHKYMVL